MARIIGCSGFGYSLGCVDDGASDNIQEIIYMGVVLMWNDAAVYGRRMGLKILARD